jgi:uncharacterized protein GlcG (DUF336 family)
VIRNLTTARTIILTAAVGVSGAAFDDDETAAGIEAVGLAPVTG